MRSPPEDHPGIHVLGGTIDSAGDFLPGIYPPRIVEPGIVGPSIEYSWLCVDCPEEHFSLDCSEVCVGIEERSTSQEGTDEPYLDPYADPTLSSGHVRCLVLVHTSLALAFIHPHALCGTMRY